MLKQLTLSLLMCVFAALTMSVAVAPVAEDVPVADVAAEAGLPADAFKSGMDDFLALTPKKYREMTGNKLSLKETIALKMAQKKIKKQLRKQEKGKDDDIPKGLFIVCAIFLPIAAVIFMGIMDDWEGNNWWIAALLYFACYLPGLIYTLVKMKEYY